MEENLISVSKTARVVTAGTPSSKIAVVVLHGYAQLSARFLEKMIVIPDVYWVAPEALNRFYIEGFSGNIGASWMTKELREADIADNLNYLNTVFNQFIIGKDFEKVVILGFSQGGATAIRYAYTYSNYVDTLVVWGSDFPKELTLDFKKSTSAIEKYFVLGNQDQFFTSEIQTKLREQMEDLGFENVIYEGKHKVEIKVLESILNGNY